MSFWRPGHNSMVEDQSEIITKVLTKTYSKINITSKLQVIQALDNGQCKADIAREYGLHPQTIAYIYKQRDSIVKKHTAKNNLLKQVHNLNLEQKLLCWFEQQFKNGNVITEDHLRNKAREILKPLNEEFTCINDWLFSFLMRHNISKHKAEDVCDPKSKEEWKRFQNIAVIKDIYLGGVCALSHTLDINSYLNGQNVDDHVSLLFIVNTLGTDKREITVVGKDLLESEGQVRSLPLNYYYSDNAQINYSVIVSILTKWDIELCSKGKTVILILNIPDNMIRKLNFNNVRIVNATDLNYVMIVTEKIIECFKYHYRRIQISRNITYGKDSCTFLDYLYMVGNAWYHVPQQYVQRLSMPPREGSLYFNVKDDNENDHSISQWCTMYNVTLNTEQCQSSLDKYIFCDKKLPCICYDQDDCVESIEVLNQKTCQPTSGMEAYQAMKRLVSYLQSESAGGSIMKYAKYLENHMEYGALLQMHEIIGSTNNSI